MTRKKYTSKFKAESLKERASVAEMAQKFDLAPHKYIFGSESFLVELRLFLSQRPRAGKRRQKKRKINYSSPPASSKWKLIF